MTTLGKNLKWTLGRSQRQAMRNLFDVFDVKPATPSDDFDIYTLADGANIGVYIVDDADALNPEQMERGAWIELAVEDEEATAAKLAECGFSPFDYSDKQHRYYHAPGGQVFRLASGA